MEIGCPYTFVSCERCQIYFGSLSRTGDGPKPVTVKRLLYHRRKRRKGKLQNWIEEIIRWGRTEVKGVGDIYDFILPV